MKIEEHVPNRKEIILSFRTIDPETKEDKTTSISVTMPVWTKTSEHCNLLVKLPLLGIETIAKDENDADKSIEEAIISFCLVAEKFGQGLEKELQRLGWTVFTKNGNKEPMIGYSIEENYEALAIMKKVKDENK